MFFKKEKRIVSVVLVLAFIYIKKEAYILYHRGFYLLYQFDVCTVLEYLGSWSKSLLSVWNQ